MSSSPKLYPDVPARRTATIIADVVLMVLLVLMGWLGVKVHDTVDRLAVLGEGVTSAGQSVQDGFDSAANAVGRVPVIGDDLAGALQGAGQGTGGNVADLGQRGQDSVHQVALVLGLVVFLVPAVLVLALMLPRRVRQVRSLTAARDLLVNLDDPERRRLLAMRAAFGLRYTDLLPYTRDPLGDLVEGRLDPLVRAALDDAGLRVPATL